MYLNLTSGRHERKVFIIIVISATPCCHDDDHDHDHASRARLVQGRDGDFLPFDALVLAVGARTAPEEGRAGWERGTRRALLWRELLSDIDGELTPLGYERRTQDPATGLWFNAVFALPGTLLAASTRRRWRSALLVLGGVVTAGAYALASLGRSASLPTTTSKRAESSPSYSKPATR